MHLSASIESATCPQGSAHTASKSLRSGRLLARVVEGARPRRVSRHESRRLHTLQALDQEKAVSNLDVSEAVVNPSFRSTPWQAERQADGNSDEVARIVFVSESNMCRSPIAQAAFTRLLRDTDLTGQVEIASRATRDYNIGEAAEPSAVAAAESLGVEIPADFAARRFDFEKDTVLFDLILVMDKFTAADVMREISVYDTINRKGNYTQKVRRLGEFHPVLQNHSEPDGQDIDDPLYGNEGGQLEADAVQLTASLIQEACEGLLDFLQQLREDGPDEPFATLLRNATAGMKELDWVAPPMLSPR